MDTVIQLDNIKKIFGDHISLRGISLQVRRGDIFGYLGANGAGKTTTIRILLDLLRPSYGSASVLGLDTRDRQCRYKTGFVLDADGLYNNLSARENLDFYSRLYGLKKNYKKIEELLEKVGLQDRSHDKAGSFSKGMRQRLSLARALVHDPELLILDEPLSGIDPQGRIEIRNIILSLAQDDKKTVFFSSHDLDEVQRICKHIALLDQGQILLQGELASLLQTRDQGAVIVQLESPLKSLARTKLQSETRLGLHSIEGLCLTFHPQVPVSELVFSLAQLQVAMASVTPRRSSLEELYSSILTQEGLVP